MRDRREEGWGWGAVWMCTCVGRREDVGEAVKKQDENSDSYIVPINVL